MATTADYVDFVCEQVRGNWDVRSKKMFGEYMVYINNKPVLLVCDNTVFVKQLPCVSTLLANADKGHPYDGAKEHHILDVEDRELTLRVITELEAVVPVPKPRKKKQGTPPKARGKSTKGSPAPD